MSLPNPLPVHKKLRKASTASFLSFFQSKLTSQFNCKMTLDCFTEFVSLSLSVPPTHDGFIFLSTKPMVLGSPNLGQGSIDLDNVRVDLEN